MFPFNCQSNWEIFPAVHNLQKLVVARTVGWWALLLWRIAYWSASQGVFSGKVVSVSKHQIIGLRRWSYHCPDDGGSKHLWNVSKLLSDYVVLQPRRQPSSYLLPWQPEILNNVLSYLFTGYLYIFNKWIDCSGYLILKCIIWFLCFGWENMVLAAN
jgi:hypothetical protein